MGIYFITTTTFLQEICVVYLIMHEIQLLFLPVILSLSINVSKADFLPLELPLCPKESLFITSEDTQGVLDTPEKEDTHQIIRHNGFTLCYRERYEQPEWVAYTLDLKKIQKNVKRKDSFKPDPAVITGSASLEDYKQSGYDRGHLAPCADLTYSKESMDDSFYMSNMSPQAPGFNRDSWKDLEHEVRYMAERFDKLYIVTGPVLEKDEYKTIGANEVAVPEFYYKAVLAIRGGKYFAIGFIMPNIKCPLSIWDYAVSVDEVEKQTGLNFFYLLDDDIEEELEKQFTLSDWQVQNE